MKGKKFTQYEIKITSVNGECETIKAKGINNSNYKEMLEVYRDVKNDYKDKSCKISFIGKNCDGEVKVLWEKNNINEKNDTDLSQILNEMLNSINKYINKIDEMDISNKLSAIDKKQDIMLHKIESISYCDLSQKEIDREKIRLLDDLINIRFKRRKIKNIKVDYGVALSMVQKLKTSIKTLNNNNPEAHTYEKVCNTKSNKLVEVAYKNDADRIRVTTALKKKYGVVNIDETRKVVTAYTLCNGRKKKAV